MSKVLMENVLYLEDADVNPDGSLKSHVTQGKPTVVMVQGKFCGYCSQAKPAFEKCATMGHKCAFVTVQMDASPGEKKCASAITKNDPKHRGVPAYLGFSADGKFKAVHGGGRDQSALIEFANSL